MTLDRLRNDPAIEIQLPLDLQPESFQFQGDRIVHSIGEPALIESTLPTAGIGMSPKDEWWRLYMAGSTPASSSAGGTLTYVDLFSGPGGLALGLKQLTQEMGLRLVCEAIVDQDEQATDVYAANHGARVTSTDSVTSLVDFAISGQDTSARFRYPPEVLDERLTRLAGKLTMVLAGPPCQGHSNLNNYTRRNDKRNRLYLTVPAFAIALDVPIILIENVPTILNDSTQVVASTRRLLQDNGYEVTSAVLSAADMGWPQSRKRHFLVARRDRSPIDLHAVSAALRDTAARSVWWAIGDLEDREPIDLMDQPSDLSEENRRRVNWLFDHDAYDLDLPQRPESHKGGTTYVSVYGRLRKDMPSPTITTGFMTPGRGRYVHPTQRRALTPREAARLQGFPDTYKFVVDPANPPTRAKLAKWIGDAVPMPLGYAAALSALGRGIP